MKRQKAIRFVFLFLLIMAVGTAVLALLSQGHEIYLTKLVPSSHFLENVFRAKPKGLYYICENLCADCFPFSVYETLERLAYENGQSIKLVLVGDWSEIDLTNLSIERAGRATISLADMGIRDLFEEFQDEASNAYSSVVVLNCADGIEAFSLSEDTARKVANKYSRIAQDCH